MVINLQITPSPILRDYELQKFCDRAREDGRSPEEAVVSLILNSIGEQDIESQEEPAQEPKEEEAK